MDRDIHDRLVDVCFHLFRVEDPESIEQLVGYFMRVLEYEVRRAGAQERRQLYVRSGARSNN